MLRKARYNEPSPASAVDELKAEHGGSFDAEPGQFENPADRGAEHSPDSDSSAVARVPPDLRRVLSLADPAVLLLDDAGFFVFANEAANSLLDYGDDEILGVHFTEVCVHDLAWLEGEFRRLQRNEIWSGHVVLRGRRGRPVNMGVNAGTLVRSSDPGLFYIALIHPVGVPVQASAAELDNLPHGLTAAEVRTLQLLIEGFGRADIATVQGESERTVSGTIDGIRLKIQASSVIAACLVALKEHLVA